MSRRARVVALVLVAQLVFVLGAAPAWADAGSPLIWASAFHLLIGNALIGVFEALIVARVFHVSRKRAILFLIPANYVSAFAGFALGHMLGETLTRGDPAPLYHVSSYVAQGVFASYIASIVIEWPFCLGVTWKRPDRLRASVLASLLAQTASYPIVIGLYLAGPASLGPRGLELDPTLAFAREIPATVYFVSLESDAVWRVRADGTHLERVCDEPSHNARYLRFGHTSQDPEHWDLLAWADSNVNEKVIARGIAARPRGPTADALERAYEEAGPMERTIYLGQKPEWHVTATLWPDLGMSARSTKGERVAIAVGTTILDWGARSATLLPGEQVVFQLGDQIVLADLHSKKAGVLARGLSPAVLLDATESSSPK